MPRKGATLAKVGRKNPKIGRARPANTIRRGVIDASDDALANLLKRLKATADPNEVAQISGEIERIIFHKQFKNA